MSRIAVKIFLSFWLTLFVVAASFSLLLDALRNQEEKRPLSGFQQRQLAQHQAQLENVFRRRGLQGLQRVVREIESNRGITTFLLDDAGRDVLDRAVPDAVRAFFLDSQRRNTPQMQLRDRRLLLGPMPFQVPEITASVLLWQPMAASEVSALSGWWQGRYAGLQLGLGLLLSGMISLALAVSFTRPLNRLERAARRLAQGRFDSADIDVVARRKDEIGSLAKEFSAMATRLNAARQSQQRLLRDVSHELRSPLTRLQVAIGLASRQAPAGAAAGFERMEAECERLNALIGEVLTLARASSSELGATARLFDLAATLQALTADAQFEAQAHGKSVVLQSPDQLPFWGDEAGLASAIENAVRNAIRYTAVGTSVLLSAQVGGANVHVQVSDCGPGLPEHELDKIFTPFYRVSQARERQTGGTGVGLAISAQVVESHGGRIEARNRPSGGLVIEMTLPRSRGGALAQPALRPA